MIDYKADPRFWQRFLSSAGFPLALDGIWGPKSQEAADEFKAQSIARFGNTPLDSRSLENILTLLPAAQEKAVDLYIVANRMPELVNSGTHLKIISGTRTFAEQDALFHQVPKVTNARGGQSNHSFGVAFDVGLFQNGDYLDDSPLYAKIGKVGKTLDLEWGGDWSSFEDQPHFQVVKNEDLGKIAAAFEQGHPFV